MTVHHKKQSRARQVQTVIAGHLFEGRECDGCAASCQSACKTSCTVGNQPCEPTAVYSRGRGSQSR